MKRVHAMEFGASVIAGGARFRLWAPAATQVDLRLEEGTSDRHMTPCAEGWFDLEISGVQAGARYHFLIDGKPVPDPASRYQPEDVNGPSELVDPAAFEWDDGDWRGRPWHEAVIYELHLGTFTRQGTYSAAIPELERLARLGFTAIEVMPLSDFAGARNWGYDGVLPFAPDSRYGTPDELKALVSAAHRLGLMMFIDVVYNHFGPEGNYLPLYAPAFFSKSGTAWGQGLDFSVRQVRDFFIQNALYWLTEYHFDGLRFDAVHAIEDESQPHFIAELAETVRQSMPAGRHVHLVLENEKNQARFLERTPNAAPIHHNAQWNDDFHHAMHVILTGETAGYYADFATAPIDKLGRALTQGFIYQGEWSDHAGSPRGEPSAHLPPAAFVNFIQNHDQIGNRAFGERLISLAPREALVAAIAILLLAPSPPLLFMGEELGATDPFLFFCDFGGDLGESVRQGRRAEFKHFPAFADPSAREAIPDPLAVETFERSRIDGAVAHPDLEIHELYRALLDLRHREVIPRLSGSYPAGAGYAVAGALLSVWWRLGDGSRLALTANLSANPAERAPVAEDERIIWGPDGIALQPWALVWSLAS